MSLRLVLIVHRALLGILTVVAAAELASASANAREVVNFKGYSTGTIVIKTRDHTPGAIIPGGSPANPMGAAAMTLSGGGEYAIHGTNNPGSIGGFVSHGCIRMHNQDILDLYDRVSYGTTVVVLR